MSAASRSRLRCSRGRRRLAPRPRRRRVTDGGHPHTASRPRRGPARRAGWTPPGATTWARRWPSACAPASTTSPSTWPRSTTSARPAFASSSSGRAELQSIEGRLTVIERLEHRARGPAARRARHGCCSRTRPRMPRPRPPLPRRPPQPVALPLAGARAELFDLEPTAVLRPRWLGDARAVAGGRHARRGLARSSFPPAPSPSASAHSARPTRTRRSGWASFSPREAWPCANPPTAPASRTTCSRRPR